MKQLLVIALFSLLLPLSLIYAKEKKEKANTAAGDGNVEQEIKNLQDQGREAALKGDTSFLEKYLADDYAGIGAEGQMFTKSQAIERRKAGTLKYEAIDVLDSKIHSYGDAAIANILASVKGTDDGKSFSGDYRATFVWVKQKGNWKQVSFQSTAASQAK
jgi:ketosteroid isomerase-like protein